MDYQDRRIPKKAFDAEYSTQWLREVDFLKSRDIFPSFVYTNDKTRVSTYKYTKKPELFLALIEFYMIVKYEKQTEPLAKPKTVVPENLKDKTVAKKTGKKEFKQKYKQITIDDLMGNDTDGDKAANRIDDSYMNKLGSLVNKLNNGAPSRDYQVRLNDSITESPVVTVSGDEKYKIVLENGDAAYVPIEVPVVTIADSQDDTE